MAERTIPWLHQRGDLLSWDLQHWEFALARMRWRRCCPQCRRQNVDLQVDESAAEGRQLTARCRDCGAADAGANTGLDATRIALAWHA